ncbi:MAG: hypothetical protein E7182_04160 [Erysipelotrichaceae bacterium]|nr:hypothetical protein [Erysipelotrichaceae bacterium]
MPYNDAGAPGRLSCRRGRFALRWISVLRLPRALLYAHPLMRLNESASKRQCRARQKTSVGIIKGTIGENHMEIIKSEKGSLTILTGKTDMGKSTLTVYDASEYLKIGSNVIFFSYEYCQSIIYNKLISHFDVGWGNLFQLNIVDASGLTLKTLEEIVRSKKGSVDVVYVDYLDLLKNATFGETTSEEENLKQIQIIVESLASLAKELNIAVVLLSQLGSSADFETCIATLNSFAAKAKGNNVIKMFIGKGNIIDARINYDDIVHVILIDGYDLRHFSSVNIREIYKDK